MRWRIDIAKILLKHNVDVNAKSNESRTILYYAAGCNS
ncbi:ankyrin repeat domain-containing protein [Wolbachia endosymbiont of Brugia pahangi]